MTQTSHGHHIAGTPIDSGVKFEAVNCGGPGPCSICSYDIAWFEERDAKRAALFPSAVEGLNTQVLRKISAKLRDPNLTKRGMWISPKRQATPIYALADAIDGVADDLDGLKGPL